MASAPSVETVLTKITQHNDEIIGCIAATDDDLYLNLPDAYELVDSEGMVEHASNVFKLTDSLEMDQNGLDQLFLEFDSHSLYARRLSEDSILILVNDPIRRTKFKKLKVGVNLYLQPLERALQKSANTRVRRRDDGTALGRIRRVFGNLV